MLRRTPLRAKKNIRRVGKVGRANQESRKMIADYAEEHELDHCELQLSGCTGNWPLAPAHRHKRAWYKGDKALLADPNQWVAACQNCHDKIEHNAELTEEVFIKLRGAE